MFVARNKNIGNIFQVTSVMFTITNDFLTVAEYYINMVWKKSQKGYFYKMSSVIQFCFVHVIFYTDKEGSKNFYLDLSWRIRLAPAWVGIQLHSA